MYWGSRLDRLNPSSSLRQRTEVGRLGRTGSTCPPDSTTAHGTPLHECVTGNHRDRRTGHRECCHLQGIAARHG